MRARSVAPEAALYQAARCRPIYGKRSSSRRLRYPQSGRSAPRVDLQAEINRFITEHNEEHKPNVCTKGPRPDFAAKRSTSDAAAQGYRPNEVNGKEPRAAVAEKTPSC